MNTILQTVQKPAKIKISNKRKLMAETITAKHLLDVTDWTREEIIADLGRVSAEIEKEHKAGTLKTAREVFAELDKKFNLHVVS